MNEPMTARELIDLLQTVPGHVFVMLDRDGEVGYLYKHLQIDDADDGHYHLVCGGCPDEEQP